MSIESGVESVASPDYFLARSLHFFASIDLEWPRSGPDPWWFCSVSNWRRQVSFHLENLSFCGRISQVSVSQNTVSRVPHIHAVVKAC